MKKKTDDKTDARAKDLCLRAFVHLQVASPAPAEGLARRAVRLQEHNPQPHALLALALRGMGRFGEAEKHARQALELAPGQPDYLFTLGLCLWSAGDPREAQSLFEQALAKAPERSDMQMDFAGFLIHQQQFDEALDRARKAHALAPDHPKPKVLEECARDQVWRAGVDDLAFRPPLPLAEDDPQTFVRLGAALIDSGYQDLALSEFSRALDLDPDQQQAQALYATAFVMRKNANYAWFRSWRTRLGRPGILVLTLLPLVLAGLAAGVLYARQEILPAALGAGVGLLYLLGTAYLLLMRGRPLSPEDFQTLVQSRNLTPQGRHKRTDRVLDELDQVRSSHQVAQQLGSDAAIPSQTGSGEDQRRLRRHLEDRSGVLRNYSNALFSVALLALVVLTWTVIRMKTTGVLITPALILTERLSSGLALLLVAGAFAFRAKARRVNERR